MMLQYGKKMPIGVLRNWAKRFEVRMPTELDLEAAGFVVADVPVAKWVVPEACGRNQKTWQEDGDCADHHGRRCQHVLRLL